METVIVSGLTLAQFSGLIRAEVTAALASQTPQPVPTGDDLLTIAEAVKDYKTSRVTIWKARQSGRLRAYLNGRKVLFRRSDLENLLTPATA